MTHAEVTVDRLQQCIAEIHRWCSLRRLQMNPYKTELIWFGSCTDLQNLAALPGASSLAVTHNVVQGVSTVRDLRVTLDSELLMQNHVNKVARTCFCHTRRLKQVRKRLGPDVTSKLLRSLVFSRLDYCNTVLAGLPRSTIAQLQQVQNATARVVAHLGPRDHVNPTLKDRHWLLIEQLQIVSADVPSSHWTSSILSAKLRHCISWHDLTSSSALHKQSMILIIAHASEVWRTFIFLCRTMSLE